MRSRFSLVCLALCLAALPACADVSVKRLAPGVTLTQEIDKTTPLIINVVLVDLSAPGVRVEAGIGQDKVNGTDASKGREDVSRYARRHGALVVVNADFFPFTGDPLGIGIHNGELFSEPFVREKDVLPRAAMGVTDDGRTVLFDNLSFLGDLQAADGQRTLLAGINRPAAKDEIVALTATFGAATAGQAGRVEAIVTGVNLPVRANKLVAGKVEAIGTVAGATPIPADALILSATGAGAAWLAQHVHAGERLSFVLAVAPPGETNQAVQIATLPRRAGDLPSRAGAGISRKAFQWAAVKEAVGGGPRLVTNGQTSVNAAAEGFGADFSASTHPRTAVGTTKDGKRLLIVTVDGRQAISKGVALDTLAAIMKRYGAWNAINFDGGGSTALAVAGLVVNAPSGSGAERPVADLLCVYSDRAAVTFPPSSATDPEASEEGAAQTVTNVSGPRLVVPPGAVLVGSATPLAAWDGRRKLADVLWQGPATGGIGFVNQRGYFVAMKPGVGTVTALAGKRLLTAAVTVIGKPILSVFSIRAAFVADSSGAANRSQLTVRVLDQNGKPKPGASVHVSVTGGASDQTDTFTNIDGGATVGVTWNGDAGGSVTLSSGGLAPVMVRQP